LQKNKKKYAMQLGSLRPGPPDPDPVSDPDPIREEA